MRKKYNSATSVALVITIITIICKMLGFLKNSMLAYYYGTSPIVDAYIMTFSIGTITCGWIAGVVGNFTPTFKRIEAKDGRKDALIFSSNLHNFILLLIIALVIILEFIAPSVVKIMAPGFAGTTYDYTVFFLRIYLISVLFYAGFRFLNEFLNCNQKHLWATAPDILQSTCCIVAIVASSRIGDFFLIFGYVIAIGLQCILVHIGAYKIGFRHKTRLKWDENLRDVLFMTIPIFMSNTLAEINTLIDKAFASKLESGIVASLDYANTMKEFAFQIGTIAMVSMIFPVLSQDWAEKRIEKFKETILRSVNFLTILYVPIITGIILTGDLIINIVFRRGQFGEESAVITTNAFIIYSIALLPLVYRSVFLKAFYSMQKMKYILLMSFVNVVLNIVLNIIFIKYWGYIGLAMATSLAAWLCIPLYFGLLAKSVWGVRYKELLIKLFKVICASGMMFVSVWLVRSGLVWGDNSNLSAQLSVLMVSVVVGGFIYVVVCYLMKVDEVVIIFQRVREKVARKK